MRNRELLERFIQDNFNKEMFEITWVSDFAVELKDMKGDVLSLFTMQSNYVLTAINGTKHLEYRYGTDLWGDKIWFVI